jgi:asparagine synthase (glutamine-hydrolysing)
MSVQFGRWSFAGEAPAPEYMEKVSMCIAPYGPDSTESYSAPGIRILYRGFHTTKESRREKQPHISPSGAVITWDGRLDNRDDLISELSPWATHEDTDVAIVGAGFEKWGTNCFARLIGDWALSIWNPRLRSLILAKDPIGPRHLYYSFDDKQITWCTVLDPLVLFADKTFKLCQEYIAGWLSLYPATHLTPYVGISSVPPSCCVFLGPRKHIVAKYWDFDPSKKIRYSSDGEYEEQFRAVFFQAIERRLRSDTPVLAELSGGRDSSSIVCVADEIMARGEAEMPRLDTISYYDDSEPNWNERPYFGLIEKKRGRMGWHVDVSLSEPDGFPNCALTHFDCPLVPTSAFSSYVVSQLQRGIASNGYRVLLSGVGGDEVMGGAPIPTPEFQDALAGAQFGALARLLKAWAIQKRKPWFHLVFEAGAGFLPPRLVGVPQRMRPAAWLRSDFTRHYWIALAGYPARVRLFDPLPSFQDSINTLNNVRRHLAAKLLPPDITHDTAYPYLDRTLLEFMYAIPRMQLVRPAQRRSLMRRALTGVVPPEILDRKGKAFVERAPLMKMSSHWPTLISARQGLLLESLGIVDSERLLQFLKKARYGKELYWAPLIRAMSIENWLRKLRGAGILDFAGLPIDELEFRTSDTDPVLSARATISSSGKA